MYNVKSIIHKYVYIPFLLVERSWRQEQMSRAPHFGRFRPQKLATMHGAELAKLQGHYTVPLKGDTVTHEASSV